MATYHIATVNATGEKFPVTKDGLVYKGKVKTYGYIVGYKIKGPHVQFTYEKEKTFLADAVTIERDVEMTSSLVTDLHQQYFAHLRANGKEIVRTTGPRARNQKYMIR